jgi:hypothetical protein
LSARPFETLSHIDEDIEWCFRPKGDLPCLPIEIFDMVREDDADDRTRAWERDLERVALHVASNRAVTDTLARVPTKEPNWTALPANTPAPIRKWLRRCLEKDRRRRLESVADTRLEIEDALMDLWRMSRGRASDRKKARRTAHGSLQNSRGRQTDRRIMMRRGNEGGRV